MANRQVIIEDILNKVNTDKLFDGVVSFNELSTSVNSMCFVDETSTSGVNKDCTCPNSIEGILNLGVVYRVISVDDGIDDLVYNQVVDDILNYIKLVSRSVIGTGYFIDGVSGIVHSKVVQVYEDGTKDYKGTINLNYYLEV